MDQVFWGGSLGELVATEDTEHAYELTDLWPSYDAYEQRQVAARDHFGYAFETSQEIAEGERALYANCGE